MPLLIPTARARDVSVLFSEPKIPQFSFKAPRRVWASAFQCSSASRKFLNSNPFLDPAPAAAVSVLFSEPKIPQFVVDETERLLIARFSALQRAENSSIAARLKAE